MNAEGFLFVLVSSLPSLVPVKAFLYITHRMLGIMSRGKLKCIKYLKGHNKHIELRRGR